MADSLSEINYENLRQGLGFAFADRIRDVPSNEWVGFSEADCYNTQTELMKVGIPAAQAEGMAASAVVLADLATAAMANVDPSSMNERDLLDGSPIVLVALVNGGAIEQTDKVKIANAGGVPSLCFGRVAVPIEQKGDVFTVGALEAMGIQSQQEKGGKSGSYYVHHTIFTDGETSQNFPVRFKTVEGIADALLAQKVRSGASIADFLDTASSGGTGNLKTLTAGGVYKVEGVTASANPFKNGAPRFALDLGSHGRFWAQKGAAEFLSHFCDAATMQMSPEVADYVRDGLFLRMLSIKAIDDKRSSVECDLRFAASVDLKAVIGGAAAPAAIAPAAAAPAAAPSAPAEDPAEDPGDDATADQGTEPEVTDDDIFAVAPAEAPAARKRSRLGGGLKAAAAAV